MTFSKGGCLGGGVVCAIGSGIVGKPVIGATALALGCAMVSACPVGVLFCTARSLAGAIPIAPAPGPSCKKHDERTGRRHKPIIHFPFTQFGCGRGAKPRGRDVVSVFSWFTLPVCPLLGFGISSRSTAPWQGLACAAIEKGEPPWHYPEERSSTG